MILNGRLRIPYRASFVVKMMMEMMKMKKYYEYEYEYEMSVNIHACNLTTKHELANLTSTSMDVSHWIHQITLPIHYTQSYSYIVLYYK